MYLEPVGAPAVSRAGLGHAHHQALPQATCLAGGAILLVDHADAAVLAFGNATQIVVGAPEERLCNRKRNRRALINRLTICTFALLDIRRTGETRIEISVQLSISEAKLSAVESP